MLCVETFLRIHIHSFLYFPPPLGFTSFFFFFVEKREKELVRRVLRRRRRWKKEDKGNEIGEKSYGGEIEQFDDAPFLFVFFGKWERRSKTDKTCIESKKNERKSAKAIYRYLVFVSLEISAPSRCISFSPFCSSFVLKKLKWANFRLENCDWIEPKRKIVEKMFSSNIGFWYFSKLRIRNILLFLVLLSSLFQKKFQWMMNWHFFIFSRQTE